MTLLEEEVNNDDIDDDDDDHILNRPISEAENLLAFSKIKLRKALGPDRIIGEMRYSGNEVVHFFVKLFNTFLRREYLQTGGRSL